MNYHGVGFDRASVLVEDLVDVVHEAGIVDLVVGVSVFVDQVREFGFF